MKRAIATLTSFVLGSAVVIIGAGPASAAVVDVEAVVRVSVNSYSVSDNEQTLTYDFDVSLDYFPQPCGSCKVVVSDGDGDIVGRKSIQTGQTVNFHGTDNIGGGWRHTPEEIGQFRVSVYKQVGYNPTTVYQSQRIPLDFGYRSPAPEAEIVVNQTFVEDGKFYYDIDVNTYSLGGAADEVCGFLAPYANCSIVVAVVTPDGDRHRNLAVSTPAYGHRTKNISTIGTNKGIVLDAFPPGSQVTVFVIGSTNDQPSRRMEVGVIPTEPTEPIRLRAIEVNQSVQDWNNSVPLVAHKDTLVRVFVETTRPDGEIQHVSGSLLVQAGGTEVELRPTSERDATNPRTVAAPYSAADEAVRIELLKSLNYLVPTRLLEPGSATFTFVPDSLDIDCDDLTGASSECAVTVGVVDVPAPTIHFYAIDREYVPDVAAPTFVELVEQRNRVKATLPIDRISGVVSSMTVPYPTGDSSIYLPLLGYGAHDLAWVNEWMLFNRALRDCPTCKDDIYYGVVKPDSENDESASGLAADIPASAASSFLDAADANGKGYYRNVAAHEVGHALGQPHAVNRRVAVNRVGTCGEKAWHSAPDHPYYADLPDENGVEGSRAVMGPLGSADTEIWGVDTLNLQRSGGLEVRTARKVINPNDTFALMSYCRGKSFQGKWISSFAYEHLMGNVIERFGNETGTGGSEVNSGNQLAVTGVVMFEPETGEFVEAAALSILALTGTASAEAPGADAVRVYNGDDLVAEAAIAVGEFQGNGDSSIESGVVLFQTKVFIGDADYDRVEIVVGGEVVQVIDASENAPTVKVTSPHANAKSADDVTVRWAGKDADGDDLTYSVRYSPDGGTSWEPVAYGISESSVVVPRSSLAGSAGGVFEVIASDGVLSGSAKSEPIPVANNAPQVAILGSPEHGVTYEVDAEVNLAAGAYDVEDGFLEGDVLVWTSDVDGVIGSGEMSTAWGLSEGVHRITVTATDSSGNASSASVVIGVGVDVPASAEEQLTGLRAAVLALEAHANVEQPLIDAIDSVEGHLSAGRVAQACDALDRFSKLAAGRIGDNKGITQEQYDDLAPRVDALHDAMGCDGV